MSDRENQRKLELLGAAIHGGRVAVITHNNPDPDCIAAALGLSLLLKEHFKKEPAIFYGGLAGRAENRSMIRELKIKMMNIRECDHSIYRTVALVDTQPGAGNNSLKPDVVPDIVIDHHVPIRKKTRAAPFHDIRPHYGSSSTIIFEYLMSAGLEIPRRAATALFYGIKTDTYDLGREFIQNDIDAYYYCAQRMDRKLLHKIERPLHRHSYFVQMHEALSDAEIIDDLIFSVVWNADYPEIAAEVADWLYSMRGIKWVLVVATDPNGGLYLSVRTRDRKRNAGRLINKVVGRHGMAGGHSLIAGGSIHLENASPDSISAEVQNVKNKFFKLLSKKQKMEPIPLIPPAGRHHGA